MSLTILGIILMFLFPVLILAYDAWLKFGKGDETISEYIWSHPRLKVAACVYLGIWAVVLIAHLGFMFLPG